LQLLCTSLRFESKGKAGKLSFCSLPVSLFLGPLSVFVRALSLLCFLLSFPGSVIFFRLFPPLFSGFFLWVLLALFFTVFFFLFLLPLSFFRPLLVPFPQFFPSFSFLPSPCDLSFSGFYSQRTIRFFQPLIAGVMVAVGVR